MALRAPAETDFSSRLHSPAVAARIGTWLGITFGIAFLTGLVSHWAQVPDPPVPFPTRPVWGYRVTQGLHVISGTAAIPLLLVKLWTVYPRLFQRVVLRPPRAAVLHGLERASIAVLVGAGIFQLSTGLMNSTQWYPWEFSFRSTHYAMAWVAIGALVVHVAVKLAVIRGAYARDVDDDDPEHPPPGGPGAASHEGTLSRRGLLRTTWASAAIAVLATAGATVPLLRKVSVLGVRTGEGPQGIPINRTADAAGVSDSATGAEYRLRLVNGDSELELTPDDLAAMTQRTEELPIACVEGWSATATWTGVRLRELMDLVKAPAGSDIGVYSLQTRGAFSATRMPGSFADDPLTLLALELNGERLSPDHGFPCRVIAPNRPGVLQTKWVTRLEVL